MCCAQYFADGKTIQVVVISICDVFFVNWVFNLIIPWSNFFLFSFIISVIKKSSSKSFILFVMGKFSTWNLLSNLKTTSFQTHNVKKRAEMKNRPKVCNLVVSLPTQSPSGFWMFAINVCGKHAFLSNINIHFDRIPLENSYIRKLIENVLLDYLAAVVCGSVSVSRVCCFFVRLVRAAFSCWVQWFTGSQSTSQSRIVLRVHCIHTEYRQTFIDSNAFSAS